MIKFNLNKNSLINITFFVFAIFPLIPNNQKGLPVIFLILASLLNFKPKKVNYKWFLINVSFSILLLVSLIYSDNMDYGMKKIETSLSLFIIPICFSFLLPDKNIDKHIVQKFMKRFVFSALLFSIITLIFILLDTKTEYYKDFYSNKYRIIVEQIPLIGQHPIYASLFLGVALIFIFFLIKEKGYKSSRINYGYIGIVITSYITLLIMLSSRAVLLSLFVLILIYSIRQLYNGKNKKRRIQLLVLIIICTALLFKFNRRMNEMLQFDTYVKVNTNFSNSYRINIYKCAFKVIKKSPWIGHGLGNEKDQLIACYESENQILLLEKGYNSHNQYLDYWIKIGLIGLICFLVFLIYNLYKAFFYRNSLLFYIILFFSINFLTENVLVRQSGLIPFVFFIHFLNLKIKRNEIE